MNFPKIKLFYIQSGIVCFVGILIFLLTESALTQCSTPIKTTNTFRNLQDSAYYVGIDACKGCHSDKHATFIHTGMGASFHKAERKYSKADFKHVKPVYDSKNNLYYYPYWKNNQLYIQEFQIIKGDTTHNRIEKITHIIGSGQHTNSHFWMDGEHLYQAPLTFYTQKGIWDLPPGYEVTNTRFNRKIDIECMSCHTAMPKTREGADNIFEHLPLGIDCERCHGPGSIHVKEKSSGIIVDTRITTDWSIVNPKRLPWKLQVDICQRCHLQGNNVLKPGKKFTDFRPGMHLDSVFTVYMPSSSGDAAFVMAGHAERFQMSLCFKKSNTGNLNQYNANINFTCINCHNPHISVKQTKVEQFNQTCISCHNQQSKKSKLHQCLLLEGKKKQSCIGCHMPSSDTRDIPHVSIHDHYISKKTAWKNPSTYQAIPKSAIDLHAVNQSNPSQNELFRAYVSYFEKFDPHAIYIQKAKSLLNVDGLRLEDILQYHYSLQQYREAIQIWENPKFAESVKRLNADAWSQYRMAVSYNHSQQQAKAISFYAAACAAMPWNTNFIAEYANALVRNNRIVQAKEIILKALKHQPKHELLHFNLGNCYFKEQNLGMAIKEYDAALALDPKSQAILGLIEIYQSMGEDEKVKALTKKAKKIFGSVRF